jgi:hypothetical protein
MEAMEGGGDVGVREAKANATLAEREGEGVRPKRQKWKKLNFPNELPLLAIFGTWTPTKMVKFALFSPKPPKTTPFYQKFNSRHAPQIPPQLALCIIHWPAFDWPIPYRVPPPLNVHLLLP